MNQHKMYRCIKLLDLLQINPKPIHIISRYLGVSDRTVYRYFNLYTALGYSIEKDKFNKYKILK